MLIQFITKLIDCYFTKLNIQFENINANRKF